LRSEEKINRFQLIDVVLLVGRGRGILKRVPLRTRIESPAQAAADTIAQRSLLIYVEAFMPLAEI
jgi:hypothetical protein